MYKKIITFLKQRKKVLILVLVALVMPPELLAINVVIPVISLGFYLCVFSDVINKCTTGFGVGKKVLAAVLLFPFFHFIIGGLLLLLYGLTCGLRHACISV